MRLFIVRNNWIQKKTSHILSYLSKVVLALSILNLAFFIIWFGYEIKYQSIDAAKLMIRSSLFIYFFYFTTEIYRDFRVKEIKKMLLSFALLLPFIFYILPYILSDSIIPGPLKSIIESNLYESSLTVISSIIILSKMIIQNILNRINPFLFMSASFFSVILIGTLLLLLPRSTNIDITFIDTLFIATSAVCVTGLSPLTIGETFSREGQFIIMLLIQIGGLGAMTITSFFGLFFIGDISLSNRLALTNMLSTETIGSLLKMLLYVLGLTLLFELTGAFLLWLSITGKMELELTDEIFFCLFHSISAFCNAGFSTLPNGLASSSLINNTFFYWIISFLIIFGGIGFPILANLTQAVKYILNIKFNHNRSYYYRSGNRLSLNSRIVLLFTLILLIFGTVFFLCMEWSSGLEDFSIFNKITHSVFLSTSARTAGFNSIDIAQLSLPSILILLILMWIGGGAQSTAGGIKVNVFAVTVYTMISIVKGKNRVEVGRHQISNSSILRVFTTIILSFFILGIASFIILIQEKDKLFVSIIFECMSAMTTTGLSLNITESLSYNSKIILILLMFIGRVGLLSFFMGIIRQVKTDKYNYPIDNVIIN